MTGDTTILRPESPLNQKAMTQDEIKRLKEELRHEYFAQHTYAVDRVLKHSTHPHDLFEWFYSKIESKDREMAELKSIIFNEKANDKKFVAAMLEEVEKGKALLNELVSDHNKEVAELKAEIERLKGEAESRAKDAWERACDIQHTICLTSIPETAEKQVYLAVRDCNKPTYQS